MRQRRFTTRVPQDPDAGSGVYIISVAARILSMHPQTLRKYERAELVRPSRTQGKLRLYSEEDIARLRLIKHLVDRGLNLAGVRLVLDLFNRLLEMRGSMNAVSDNELRRHIADSMDEVFALLDVRWR